ncbi:MAG: thioredoxin family protein [bacterium]|nr:thioredoxin family protein [bacterium]
MKLALGTCAFLGALLFYSFVFSPPSSALEQQWEVDFDTAKSKAGEDKLILMSFRGSDWCAACKRLEKTFFEDEEFLQFAADNLVLLKLDFPMKKANQLEREQTKHNEALAEKYNPDGKFPRVLLFNGSGELLGELKTPMNSTDEYINAIKKYQE